MTDVYANLEFKELNYQSYLKIPQLLALQQEVSDPIHHDEMFFIVIHQASELWFKNLLHETEWLVESFEEGLVSRSLKILKRITAIMELLDHQIGLLATLTPVEFAGFRDLLRPASGFQSAQFRLMEYRFGIKEPFFLKFFEHDPAVVARLTEAQEKPSVYDSFLRSMKKAGFPIPDTILNRDVRQPYQANPDLELIYRDIYNAPGNDYHWVLMFEGLLDFDEKLARWRQTHILMVTRTIGALGGTGGSSGAEFLKSRAGLRCFPELWSVRNYLGGSHE
ncbi:MAG: tryptophan 2,3-dioxygenase [Acidobacteria bacterium]|nr:tryptophan 2,3-dioxygenase [Acidobacteriota bacterium]MCB9399512.1 tryptophan 2,3-dioxygenase [Acidobacteriota bacterium]